MPFCHGVQCATILEPLHLRLVEGVSELGFPSFPVLWMYPQRHRLANGEFGAHEVDLVIRVDLFVVFRVDERQREHPLLLKVGFVLQKHRISFQTFYTQMSRLTHNTSKTPRYDSETPKMSRFKCGVLSGAPFTVVPVTDYNPFDTLLLVVSRGRWYCVYVTGDLVLYLVSLSVRCVDRANEHVVGDVVKVATVLEPRASH